MQKLFSINNKEIKNIDTTILYTSEYNYNTDAVSLLNNGCTIISKNSHLDISDIQEDLLREFNCTYLKKKKLLTKEDEYKINILASLSSPSKAIVFLNILTYLDNEFKKNIIKYLKNNNCQIINYTTDIEETLLLDYIILIHNNEVVMEGQTSEVLKEEAIIKKLGFKLPTIVELSSGLKLYGLVNKIYIDKESLVNDLWK